MFKFLRKYNKWILAVGGTLLLIVFLVPQAITGLSQQAAVSGATQATVGPGNKDVPVAELEDVLQEMQYMQQIGLGVPGLGALDDPWHWYLLVREADQAGLIGGGLGGLTPEQVRGSGYSAKTIEGVFTKISGVSRLLDLYLRAGQFSDYRLRKEAQELFHAVQVQSVVIPAADELDGFAPSEAEIETQMKEWAEFAPGDPEARFGYRLPDRVQLEWLTVPGDSVRAVLETGGELSGTALRKHWRQNPGGNAAFPPVPEVAPAEVPDVVRQDLLDTLAAQKLEDIGRFATNQLRSRTHVLSRKDGYLQLPADWPSKRLSLTELAGMVVERFAIARPAVSTDDRWLAAADLDTLEGIGVAGTDKFPPGRKTLSSLVAIAKEFGGSTTIQVQSGVAGPLLEGEDGTLYVFRITGDDASRPPAGIDEVRDLVVRDLKRIRNYETLKSRLDAIKQQVVTDGLIATALDYDTVVQRQRAVSLYDPGALFRQTAFRQALTPEPSPLPEIGVDKPTVEAIIAYARTLPDDLEATPEAERIMVLPVDGKLSVLIARLVEQQPFTEQDYIARTGSSQIQQILRTRELEGAETLAQAFSYDALKLRHNFKPLAATSQPADQPDAEAEADSKTRTDVVAGADAS